MKSKMMRKRILALLLCTALMMNGSISAFADSADGNNTVSSGNVSATTPESESTELPNEPMIIAGKPVEPSASPEPTIEPSEEPTMTPEATVTPSAEPTASPEATVEPSAEPTAEPTPTPTTTVSGGDVDKSLIDVETVADWEATLPDLTGVYGDDVVAIANSQLGYTQSAEDVSRNADGEVVGYFSRYGSWNETPYAEWNALFVRFCLNNANISTDKFPQADTAAEWIVALQSEEYDLFIPATVSPDEYEPCAGDLIFLDTDEVGIIKSVTDDAYQVIQERGGAVSEVEYTKADASIIGYGMLPINMADENGVEDEGASYEEEVPVTSTHVNTHEMENDIPYPEKSVGDYNPGGSSGNDAMRLNKTISGTSDPNIFDLTLDAYGTGTQAEVSVTTPMDIVLVLDASGSMSQSDHYITVSGDYDLESFNKVYEGCTFYDYSSSASVKEKYYLKNAIIKEINQETGKVKSYWSYHDTYGQYIPRPNPITYCKDCGKWIKETRQDVVAEREVVNEGEEKYYVQSNYTYEEVDIIALMNSGGLFETNMQATERGLKEFVAMVEAQGKASGVEHRISIVSYGYYYAGWGARINSTNDLITSGLLTSKTFDAGLMLQYRTIYNLNSQRSGTVKASYEDDMSNTFMSLNDAGELNKIDRAIWRYQDVAYCSAYTSTHYGMKMARDILNRRANTDRASESDAMVVVFADGAPGNGMNFYQSWANASLDYANEIKAMDVPIYVVGLYDQADATDVGTKENYNPYYNTSNRFFNYLSSNYNVELQDTNNGAYYDYAYNGPTSGVSDAVISATKNSEGKQYFYSARNGEALTQAFNSIATSVENKATTSINLDSTTVMREQISKYFELECGCTGDKHTCVEVYTQTWDGTAFGDEVKVYPGTSQDPDVQDVSVTIKDGKTIDVSGFSYKDFPVTTEYGPLGDVIGGSGKKLVLKVKVETEEGFWGGNNVPTNERPSNGLDQTGTAIYFENEVVDGGVFPVPEANVPLHLNIEALDKTIYYGGDISADDLIDKITAGYKTTVDDTQGDPNDTIGNLKVTVNADGTLTPAEDWMDDYATITWDTYANKSWPGEYSSLPIDAVSNTEEGEYLFKVTVTPKKSSTTNTSGHPGITAANGAIAGTLVATPGLSCGDIGNAYILVPVVTFKDSVINLGFVPDQTYYESTNRLPDVTWVRKDVLDNLSTNDYNNLDVEQLKAAYKTEDTFKTPAVDTTTKPTLTFTYEPNTAEYGNFVKDIPVNVAVTSTNDKAEKSILMSDAMIFRWLCNVDGDDKTDAGLHQTVENISTPHTNSGSGASLSEFWIHVTEPYELPATGGPGTLWYIISGLMLMLGSTLILHRNKYKEVLRQQ